ncbi:MAG: type II secretion system F family protein [Candidatus Omnitrophica bacterium]|nr:type II secretion system F family protein [Candidatus Omnitrophota bacterium]
MPNFEYSAKDKAGQTISGESEATNENEVVQLLHMKGLVVVSIKATKKKSSSKKRIGKVKLDDLVVFSRQLATLIDSGIPLVGALGILIDQVENPSLKEVVLCVRRDVESGLSFCESLAKHPKVFSSFFISMVRAGETSGMLDDVLERVASYLEKTAALTRKVKSSLVYPAIVIVMAIAITSVLLLKVVPTFKGIFDMLGGNLPFPTLVLITISDILKRMLVFVIFGFFVLGALFKKYINTERGRYNFDKTMLKVPVLGMLFRKVAVAKFSRTLSTLVKSGVSILDALSIVAKTSGNKVVEEAVNNSLRAVREGEPIAKPLARSKVFPPMVTAMVGVGEQTGKLETMLTKIADFYDDQVDAAVAGLTSMIEPLVIAFLGVIIGGIVIALFLPILQITQLMNP